MANGIAVVNSGAGHTWAHQSGVVGFNLEVDVVGMRIVLPVARSRSVDPVEDVVAGALVGMPQLVLCIGEGVREVADGCIKTLLLEHVDKGEVHIQVIVQPGECIVVILDAAVVPYYLGVIGYNPAVVLELGGATKGAANGLSGPSTLNLV